MIHCGSRGFGHQVATDALVSMEKAMKRDNIEVALERNPTLILFKGERPPASMRPNRQQGGAGVPQWDGGGRQLCLGQQKLYDLPGKTGSSL